MKIMPNVFRADLLPYSEIGNKKKTDSKRPYDDNKLVSN